MLLRQHPVATQKSQSMQLVAAYDVCPSLDIIVTNSVHIALTPSSLIDTYTPLSEVFIWLLELGGQHVRQCGHAGELTFPSNSHQPLLIESGSLCLVLEVLIGS